MTDAEIRALAQECGFTEHTNRQVWQSWDGEVLAFARRCLAIGRAEAFEEAVKECATMPDANYSWSVRGWLAARAAEERAKS